jgi:hypothetical protein
MYEHYNNSAKVGMLTHECLQCAQQSLDLNGCLREFTWFCWQNFQTEYLSRKPSKPAVQKSIAKVSNVPTADLR